jgi:hypothetical protein
MRCRRLRFRQTAKTEKQARIVLGRLLEQAPAGAKSTNPQAAMTYSRHQGSPGEAVRLLPL